MSGLQIFFSYFGGKWRAAPHYPKPLYKQIVEPFAGAAGYSLRYPDRDILLIDADPVICGIWDYLIHVSEEEVRRLPLDFTKLDGVPEEAKNLIRFWLNKGVERPRLNPSTWMVRALADGYDGRVRSTCYWGPEIRERIALQVGAVRHWRIVNGLYSESPESEATWFVDPPYVEAGRSYRYNAVDYGALAAWCRTRRGQTIVCENSGAQWLPFQPFKSFSASAGKQKASKGHRSEEVIWYYDSIFGEGL